MTSKSKKILFTIIGVVIAIILVVVTVIAVNVINKPKEGENDNVEVNQEKYVTQLSDGTKLNNSNNLNNTHIYKEIEISNIQFTSKNEKSVLLADVKNTGTTEFTEEEATLVLLGENNEVLREIAVYIPNIPVGETKQINSIVTADVVNVKDFRIEAKK